MTEQLAPYIDLHTHHVRSTPDTVELLSCYLSEVDTLPSHDSLYYSVGLHPWQAEELREESLPLLRKALQLPRVIALGEAGLDKATKNRTHKAHRRISRAERLRREELAGGRRFPSSFTWYALKTNFFAFAVSSSPSNPGSSMASVADLTKHVSSYALGSTLASASTSAPRVCEKRMRLGKPS